MMPTIGTKRSPTNTPPMHEPNRSAPYRKPTVFPTVSLASLRQILFASGNWNPPKKPAIMGNHAKLSSKVFVARPAPPRLVFAI